MADGKAELPMGVTIEGRLAKPESRLGIILGNTLALGIIDSQLQLRRHFSPACRRQQLRMGSIQKNRALRQLGFFRRQQVGESGNQAPQSGDESFKKF